MYDVVALGELLIDFTESGKSEQGNQLFFHGTFSSVVV